VFGKRVDERAAQDAAKAPAPRIDEAQLTEAAGEMTRYLSGPGGEDPYRPHAELQSTMLEDAGIFREETGLTAVLNQLGDFDRRVSEVLAPSSTTVYNPGWHLCRDLRNMLVVSRAVARSAPLRQESRGAHSRLDFPAFDDYWSEHAVVRKDGKDGEEMILDPTRPVVKAADLAPLVERGKRPSGTLRKNRSWTTSHDVSRRGLAPLERSMSKRMLHIWRGDTAGVDVVAY
jgi:succinate dehydrogenase / fumarate reductase flavoprotein subunit